MNVLNGLLWVGYLMLNLILSYNMNIEVEIRI